LLSQVLLKKFFALPEYLWALVWQGNLHAKPPMIVVLRPKASGSVATPLILPPPHERCHAQAAESYAAPDSVKRDKKKGRG